MTRLHDQQFWLYGAVDPYTSEIPYVSLHLTATKQTTRRFLSVQMVLRSMNEIQPKPSSAPVTATRVASNSTHRWISKLLSAVGAGTVHATGELSVPDSRITPH